jgi:hypothetical protein
MRVLAPIMLAAGLAIAAWVTTASDRSGHG